MPEETLQSRRNLWFHTGDIACIDADGLFYFRCRKAERIRVKGEMVSAFEVEEVALQHPAVNDAAAVAIPSPLGEERIRLFVSVKPGASVSEAELLSHCRASMARYMVPEVITFLHDLPRTETGKPALQDLRAMPLQNGE